MLTINCIEELRRVVREAKSEGKSVGLVPTMGALHEGHLSLIEKSVQSNGFTVVSIFVNPTQFGPNEDLAKYPRPFEADVEKCEKAGVDVVFAPAPEVVYPEGFSTYVTVEEITACWEGAARPVHFRGVATIVNKLLNMAGPDRAYFGMKDYQQFKVIQRMVRDLNMNIEIIPVATVREPDGLAKSSRNVYLSEQERMASTVLYKSLLMAKTMVEAGETDAKKLQQAVEECIGAEPLARIDYVAVADPETLEPVEKIDGQVLVALAVRIGTTRLIDNMLIGGDIA